eukprot:9477674-Pyramimonas_sp.AAC.1
MESERIPPVFPRLLHEALLAANAFIFCNEVCHITLCLGGRWQYFLGHEQPTETSDHSREQVIRRECIEAITQATAVAKTNRALRVIQLLSVSITTMKEIWSTIIVPKLRRATGEAGMARSQLRGMIPTG